MAGQITITLPDSTTLQAERGATVFDVIGAIGKGLQKAALAARMEPMVIAGR